MFGNMDYYNPEFVTYSGGEYNNIPELIVTPEFISCDSTSYASDYYADSVSYSIHEFNNPELVVIPDFSSSYPLNFHHFNTQSGLSYSTHRSPYPSSQTQFAISYSAVSPSAEFNDPEFEDYDTTPYGGGYDPAATYGKPLPPSDKICYPRTAAATTNGFPVDGFSYESIPSPYGKGEGDNGGRKINTELPDGEKHDLKNPPLEPEQKKEREGFFNGVSGNDEGDTGGQKINPELPDGEKDDFKNPPSEPEQEKERKEGSFNGVSGDYYGGRQVEIPHGYGLEAMDLCEGLFGYWPCLYRKTQKSNGYEEGCCDHNDPWKGAADYLFGTPYEEGNYGNFVNSPATEEGYYDNYVTSHANE